MTLIEALSSACSLNKAASRVIAPSALLILGMLISGCSAGSAKTASASTQPDPPQTYMAPFLVGDEGNVGKLGYAVFAYQFDDTAQTASKSTYYVGNVYGAQEGERTYFAGTTTKLARGLLSIDQTYAYTSSAYTPQSGKSWAFELPDQAGGLAQIDGGPVEPMVAAKSCPNFKTPQTYQFLTLPAPFPNGNDQAYSWNPTAETVYGSVDIGGSGSAITFNNIQQYTLPNFPVTNADGSLGLGAPATPATPFNVTSPQTGTCSPTYYGNTTMVPGNLSITDPNPASPTPPVSMVGIGPTGLLVASNAANGENAQRGASQTFYQNLLGAGTGAIGLPKPSSAVSTSALVGAQYLGFLYGSGAFRGTGSDGPSTYVASFGFATLPPDCNSVAAQTPTMIYGSDFGPPPNDPDSTQSESNGFPLDCDLAIDLGAQDPNNNGFYPNATVWLGAGAAENESAAGGFCSPQSVCSYSVPAVAIAGQLGGTNAIFVSALDDDGIPNQALGIYLFQSN
jgi:hypothetical protein